jgi:outer membrane protein assembly factor BamB
MSQGGSQHQLPADAARYLRTMRRLEQPVELVDSIMAEIEATPQVRPAPDVRAFAAFVAGAAAVLVALLVLLPLRWPNVGPASTPVPLDQLPSAGQIEARISIQPDDVPSVVAHGFVWLTNATTGELVRMDPANGSIASPLVVTEPGTELPIAPSESTLYVADRRDGALVELDPTSLDEVRRIPIGATVSAIAVDGAALWVLDRKAGEALRVDASDGSAEQTVPIAGSALLVHAGSVWVSTERGELVRMDARSGAELGRVDTGTIADDLVANGDSILVVAAGEPIVGVDIVSMRVASRGVSVLAAAAQDGRVWAVLPSNHVVRLDGASLQPVAARFIELEASRALAVGAGSLWTTGDDAAGDAYLLQIRPAA